MIARILALCLLLTGCGGGPVRPGDSGGDRASSHFEKLQRHPWAPPPRSTAVQYETPAARVAALPRAAGAQSGRESTVKKIIGEGVTEIDIYAELCTLVLEPSATDCVEAVFSYPGATASNYKNHFELTAEKSGGRVTVSTDYENGRWDTSFEPVDGLDSSGYRESAVLTVRLPNRRYDRVRLHLVTPGNALDISGVDTAMLDVGISTGDVVIQADRAYDALSVDHKVGNVTLRAPGLGRRMQVASKIGVFTLSLPEEPADILLELHYGGETAASGDQAVFLLPPTWDAAVSGRTVRYQRGNATKSILVHNRLYGVFAVRIDGDQSSVPAWAQVPGI